jgi:hypothetical protein
MRLPRLLAMLVPLALVAPLAAEAGARTVHYEGTGDHPHFTVTFDRHAHTSDYEINFHAGCDASGIENYWGYGWPSTPGARPLQVGRHGRFRMHRRFRNNWGTVFDIHFAGRLRRGAAAGTFSETDSTVSDNGDETIHCASGLVRWTARRGAP